MENLRLIQHRFNEMTEADQYRLEFAMHDIEFGVKKYYERQKIKAMFGPGQTLELLYQLGRWLNGPGQEYNG